MPHPGLWQVPGRPQAGKALLAQSIRSRAQSVFPERASSGGRRRSPDLEVASNAPLASTGSAKKNPPDSGSARHKSAA